MNSPYSLSTELLLHLAQQLPAAPRLLAELGRRIRDPQASAESVVELLRRDPTLVSRLLVMANSAAYARTEPIGSVENAVVAIGFREVHRLVGVVAAAQMTDEGLPLHGISGARMRENALFTATVMEELGGRRHLDGHTCYTVGLLRSIGKFVLERAARHAEMQVLPFSASGEQDVAQWERKIWGIDSWQVTARILQHWELPSEIVVAIEFHEHPAGRPEPAVHLLNLAAAMAAQNGYGLPGEHPRMDAETLAAAGLTEDQCHYALERAEETFRRLRGSLA